MPKWPTHILYDVSSVGQRRRANEKPSDPPPIAAFNRAVLRCFQSHAIISNDVINICSEHSIGTVDDLPQPKQQTYDDSSRNASTICCDFYINLMASPKPTFANDFSLTLLIINSLARPRRPVMLIVRMRARTLSSVYDGPQVQLLKPIPTVSQT